MGQSLKPCPFCRAQPVFTEAEWMDDGRYVGMTLECCVSMSEGVGWMMARAMTPVQRKTRLEEQLAAKWNTRPEEAIPVAEVAAGKYGNRLMWHTEDAQEGTPVGTMLYTSSAPKEVVQAGWKEAAVAWEVAASIHRMYAKGKDAVFTTRQADYVRHAEAARSKLTVVNG